MNNSLTRLSALALFSSVALIGAATGQGISPRYQLPESTRASDLRVVLTAPDTLEVRGVPGDRLLLLCGDLDPGTDQGGRRVLPRGVLDLCLDAGGRATVKGLLCNERSFVQAWQRRGAQAGVWGCFSPPVRIGSVRAPVGGGPQASLALPGDLVVTEFMKDPASVSDFHGEWIELLNNKAWRLDIEGVTLSDFSGASFTLDNGGAGVFLAAGQRFVMGNDDDPLTNGGVGVDWEWSGFSLRNSSDEIVITSAAGQYLDVVTYDDGQRWPDAPGRSISLTHGVADPLMNDDPGLWCEGSSSMAIGGDQGTPGAPNDFCP
jgi:hypothetical protein